ncbi:MAG: DUF6714 family protein [Planctomycetota bacterium]
MADREAEQVIALIEEAFDGVPRGMIGIHEADVIDDYGSIEQRREAAKLDTYRRWQDIPDEWIARHDSALCFFDPPSWKGHIPACMRWALRYLRDPNLPGLGTDSVIYSLSPDLKQRDLREHSFERYAQLNEAQRFVCARFLDYMSRQDDWADVTTAVRALDDYWRQYL